MDFPNLLTIPFLHGNRLAQLQVSPCWQRNGFSHTDSETQYYYYYYRTTNVMDHSAAITQLLQTMLHIHSLQGYI